MYSPVACAVTTRLFSCVRNDIGANDPEKTNVADRGTTTFAFSVPSISSEVPSLNTLALSPGTDWVWGSRDIVVEAEDETGVENQRNVER
jgi:hypothetical protein